LVVFTTIYNDLLIIQQGLFFFVGHPVDSVVSWVWSALTHPTH